MKAKEIKVTLTLSTPMLGTVPKDKDVYESYIESKKPTDEQTIEVDTVINGEKGTTGFHTDPDGRIFIYSYMFKGFIKAALQALKKVPDNIAGEITQNLKMVNTWIFTGQRKLYLNLPEGGEVTTLSRPLRAQTALGERIALAKSDIVPEGTTIDVTIKYFEVDGMDIHIIKEILDYGDLKGLGQWRNAEYGRFTYRMKTYEDTTIGKAWEDVADFPMPPRAGAATTGGKKRGKKKVEAPVVEEA